MTRRFTCPIHCDYVASFGCLVCQRPAVFHHLLHIPGWVRAMFKFVGARDDRKGVALCPDHHNMTDDSVHFFKPGAELGFFAEHFGNELYGVMIMLKQCMSSPSDKVQASLPELAA